MQYYRPFTPHAKRLLAHAQRGVTLIEVLVAFVIFSFGILGLVGFQSKLLVYNQSTLFRSQAAALTDDVIERMRLDPVRAKSVTGPWNTPLAQDASELVVVNPDLSDWKAQVQALLPSGQASIVVKSSSEIVVTVQWLDERTSQQSNLSVQQFVTLSRI
jgi:type IV pilus assembly protein PilV